MDAVRFRGAVSQVAVGEDLEGELGDLCKALGHPVRIRLLGIIQEVGGCSSGELAAEFELAHSTVSEHLRILKEVGLLEIYSGEGKRQYLVSQPRLSYLKSLVSVL